MTNGKQECRSSSLLGRNVRWPRRTVVSHEMYADGTDGRTPYRYIMLSARRGQLNNGINI